MIFKNFQRKMEDQEEKEINHQVKKRSKLFTLKNLDVICRQYIINSN